MTKINSAKELRQYTGKIYKSDNDDVFKEEIKKLYNGKQYDIKTALKISRFKQLSKGDTNLNYWLALTVSSIIAATATSTEIAENLKDTSSIPMVSLSAALCLIAILFVLALVYTIVFKKKYIEWYNYEMEIIIKSINKQSYPLLIEKGDRKKLIFNLIRDCFWGTVFGIVATYIATYN